MSCFCMKSSFWTLQAALFLLLMIGRINAQTQNDSHIVQSHYSIKNKACRMNTTIVECFQRCSDEKGAMDIWAPAAKSSTPEMESKKEPSTFPNITYLIANRKQEKKDPYGCLVKCLTNPKLEICKRKCSSSKPNFVMECQKNSSCNVFKSQACTDCYEQMITDTNKILDICDRKPASRGKCLTTLRDCLDHPNVKKDADITECFITKRMEEDVTDFMNQYPTCGGINPEDDAACDESLSKYLLKEYCEEFCESIYSFKKFENRKSPFEDCTGICDKTTYPLCKDSCITRFKCFENCQKLPTPTLNCFSNCEGLYYEMHKSNKTEENGKIIRYTNRTSKATLQEDICKHTIDDMRNYITDSKIRDIVLPPSDIGLEWLKRKTPEECIEACTTATKSASGLDPTCLLKEFEIILSEIQLMEYCTKDPLRLKALILYTAAATTPIPLTYVEILGLHSSNFAGFTYNTSDKIRNANFATSFLTIKNLAECEKENCTSSEDLGNDNAKCDLDCFIKHKYECEYQQVITMSINDFSQCQFIVDLSLQKTPTELWATYFNDKTQNDEKDKLESPETTQYLEETTNANSSGYFVFPYFVVIRANCDGGYYDDSFYRLFSYGSYPTVNLQYWPATARQPHQTSLRGTFRSALINLERDPDDILVPKNPLDNKGKEQRGCHLRICYPAFAVPLLLFRIPIFQVSVKSQDVFKSLFQTIYVSSFHLQTTRGSGELRVTDAAENPLTIAFPNDLFPKERITNIKTINEDEDEQLDLILSDCFGETDQYCPLIDNERDFPFDNEDLISPQYTYGSSPQIALAGFYRPNLLIIGDPDMNNFQLVNWTFHNKEQNASIFSSVAGGSCLLTEKAGGMTKPMYSQVDRNDPLLPLNYYRIKYAPKAYSQEPNGYGIFEVIALEDRFLLVTINGLVSFYGNTNATLTTNKHFKVFEDEKKNLCFKIVRTSKRALPESDIVVGITYSYEVDRNSTVDTISQEIHIGKYVKAGEQIEWEQVITSKSDQGEAENVMYNFPRKEDSGKIIPISPGKPIKLPDNYDKEISEIERICIKVFNENMKYINSTPVEIKTTSAGWCEAIDVAIKPTQIDTIQLLIRLTLFDTSLFTSNELYFYIFASHTKRKSPTQKVVWIINSVLPRIPCVVQHKENIQNVLVFEPSYFFGTGGTDDKGCHITNKMDFREHIYVTSMTYTRLITNHLFVYGPIFLQSTDAGETFVRLKSFPKEVPIEKNKLLRHRIKTMAFGNSGNYAFLTNQRELWIGNTGAKNQIRIRPSYGYSMTQTILSSDRGLQDGIPFAILYGSDDKLFEMVGILNDDGEVGTILKRPVPISLILRSSMLNENLGKASMEITKNLNASSSTILMPKTIYPVIIDKEKWGLYCAFSGPRFQENYTEQHSRNQVFFFVPPIQHPDLSKGKRDYGFNALVAFQVATYSLMWNSYFQVKYTRYSRTNRDPFVTWRENKSQEAIIGHIKYIRGDPMKDGILITPDKFKRLPTNKPSKKIYDYYYLDYGINLELKLIFSIKNDAIIENTDYFTQQISQIQLNVDNANGSLLQIDTKKDHLPAQASVQFTVTVYVLKTLKLPQNLPGQHLIPVPIIFHLIGAFGTCVKRDSSPAISDTQQTTILLGCRPATDILFNWNLTLFSIKFRDKNAHFGLEEECYKEVSVCFFARSPLVLYFDVFDQSKQKYVPYRGKYIMRIIGGGYDNTSMTKYVKEEIEAYNIPGVSDVSLIWNHWDLEKQQKIDRNDQHSNDLSSSNREPVLTSGKSAIQWACHTFSPCARISPNLAFQTVFWFRIQISNRDVEDSTLCLYETEFDIMLYGFPPSPETQLLTTILFCVCMLGILYLLFFCSRGHKKVWRATKVKMFGWYQIVKDTFPKPLKTQETEGLTEAHTQQQKDNIIFSLQGHLKIPPLLARDSTIDDTGLSRQNIRQNSTVSQISSGLSFRSRYSSVTSQQDVLNPVSARHPANTWTDLVYEQIIAKRLTAIVDKNNKMRANILRRTSAHQSGAEHEKTYEDEHKRTISQESIFSGNLDKSADPNKK